MTAFTRPKARKSALLLLAAAICTLASGCLGFEKQTVVLFFPKDGSEIQALFIYEGLMVLTRNDKKPEAKDVNESVEDLEELIRGDAVIFGDRLFRAPLKLRPNEKLDNDEQKIFDLFKPNVAISKGQFIQGKDGKLTYCQPVTLRNPQKIAAGVNKLISDAVLNEPNATQGLDRETEELFKKSASDGHAWIRFDKGRTSVTLPGNPAFFQKLRQSIFNAESVLKPILQNFDKLEKGDVDVKTAVDLLRRQANAVQGLLSALATTPISVDQRPASLTVALGYGDNEPFLVQSPLPLRPALHPDLDKDLKAQAQKMGVPVRTDVTIQDVVREFQRSGRLPKQAKE